MPLNSDTYHTPVLADACLEGLAVSPDGCYIDCTLGGGGHFRRICEHLSPAGVAVGIDRDRDAVAEVQATLSPTAGRVILVHDEFSHIDTICREYHLGAVNGILLDLGVSSHQIDTRERGFSYMAEGPLDMRMNAASGRTARDILHESSEKELQALLAEYGEVRNAGRMARCIVMGRTEHPLESTADLKSILSREYGPSLRPKMLSKVFQALRIAVNNELNELTVVLTRAVDLLASGGRLVVVAYHSLEDRLVKRFIREMESDCTCPPELPVCTCGKIRKLKRITRRALKPDHTESSINRRARSARLRIAEKVS